MNDDGKPIWEEKSEPKQQKPVQKPAPKPAPVVKTSNHITNKTEQVGNVDNKENEHKHIANKPYFRGPEVKK